MFVGFQCLVLSFFDKPVKTIPPHLPEAAIDSLQQTGFRCRQAFRIATGLTGSNFGHKVSLVSLRRF
jgi:hypothetical protein